jgi:hypothetical protein
VLGFLLYDLRLGDDWLYYSSRLEEGVGANIFRSAVPLFTFLEINNTSTLLKWL